MRDRETIDSELRRLLATGDLSSRQIDELLDERLGHRAQPAPAAPVHTWPQRPKTNTVAPQRRKTARRRLRIPAVLPLSLVAAGAAFAVMFAVHKQHTAVEPAEAPPASEQPSPPAPKPPAPPVKQAPSLPILDRAFVDTLKQEGVPVPSPDYVMAQGHAACDFLARNSDFGAAVRFVQQSSIWDANQSTDVTAGAIVSYCPQYQPSYQPAVPDQLQQTFQKAQSDLQAIEGDLQGIRDGLPDRQP
jgi:hypothetical protein